MRIVSVLILLFVNVILCPGFAKQPAETSPPSIPELGKMVMDGRDLKQEKILAKNNAYTRYLISYKSGQLTISGIMNVPNGKGPFPALILNHGYINPKIYTVGRGLKREQDYFARHGFVVIHPDYRNHGLSDQDPQSEEHFRLGYVEDVINAVQAVKESSLSFLDKERIGLLGHSLGGGICLNIMVAKPDLVDAFVLYAPVSSNYIDNYNRWIKKERPELSARSPEFWANLSASSFINNVSAPVMIHHGTADKSCPVTWSDELASTLKKQGKNFVYHKYAGEGHEFGLQWQLFMRRSRQFFLLNLKQ